jgi:Bacterial regulatory protein, arsR family
MVTSAPLAEPTGRGILDERRVSDRNVHEPVQNLALSQPTRSKHLKVLRESRLVTGAEAHLSVPAYLPALCVVHADGTPTGAGATEP